MPRYTGAMGTVSFGSGKIAPQPTYYGTNTPEKWRQEANPALGGQVCSPFVPILFFF